MASVTSIKFVVLDEEGDSKLSKFTNGNHLLDWEIK